MLSNESPKEPVSVSGKRIFAGRDKRARILSKARSAFERDKLLARNAANSGHSTTIGEISVCVRLRGGAGRTRTSDQTIINRYFEHLSNGPAANSSHYRLRLCSSVRAIIAQEGRASGTAGTIPPASRLGERHPCHAAAGHQWPL